MPDEIKQARKSDPCWERPDSEKDCGVQKSSNFLPKLNNRQKHFSIWYFIVLLALMGIVNIIISTKPFTEPVDFSEFKQMVSDGKIRRVQLGSKNYLGFPLSKEEMNTKEVLNDSLRVFKTVPVKDNSLIPLLDSLNVEYYSQADSENFLSNFFFTWVLPILFMILVWRLLFTKMGKPGNGIMSFGHNRSQLVAEGDIRVRFSDVAGIDEAREELEEVVDFLKRPERYVAVGGKIPKGVLLVGPPGTGKTLSARAVAGEAGVPFFKMSGADFVEMFVGVGAARVRDLFRQAREKAPCIIFIDELDAIGKTRGGIGSGGHDEREQTLNQLLVEMDGFDSRSGVIILAATNRPEILDPALLRPGRFDRQILIDKPDLGGREEILRRHVREVSLDDSVNLHELAARTPGFSGADLENLVNEAALLAVRSGRDRVLQIDFENAIEKITAGLERKNRILNRREREIVAYHETGHALIAAFTPGSDPVKKVTIVPRGLGALGYTMQVPLEDRFLMSEGDLVGKIDVLLGGRAGEEVAFGEVSTGAANDLVRATDIARKMITDYGMSEKYRNMVLRSRPSPLFLENGYSPGMQREYSETTQLYIDETVSRLISERYERVRAELRKKKDLLDKVAKRLLERETIGEEEFRKLVGKAEREEVLVMPGGR
ncbi:MAG: ATP-dependent zinc metalloprotease FtsH [Chitinispirillaceae bacterium]